MRHTKVGRYEGVIASASVDLLQMPSEMITKIEKDASRAVESYKRARLVKENVQGLPVNVINVPDRFYHLRDIRLKGTSMSLKYVFCGIH